MSQLTVQAQPFTLYGAGASLGDTSVTLTDFNGIDGTALTMADFGTIGYLTMEPGSSTQEEQVSFSGLTTNSNGTVTLTGIKTVLFISPYTETSGLAKSHAGATRVVISNTSAFYNNFTNRLNDVTITGLWNFSTSYPLLPGSTPTTPTQAASKGYVDSVAISGAPNASTSVQGLVQLPTQAQTDAKTATGSTGAALGVTPANLRTVLMHDYAASVVGTDAYAITLTPAVTAYTTGDIYVFKADVANTGAATLSVNGLSAITIKAKNGATLLDRDITASSINTVVYDGTNMQLLSSTGSMPISQSGREIYAASTTGNDTYVVTLSPVPLAYTNGMTVRFNADVGNTGAATLNVNGLGAIALTRPSGTALSTGDITAGNVVTAVYDGTNFQISGLVPAALTAGAGTNAGALHSHSWVNGTTTKNAADASTTQTIAHGLGYVPTAVHITFFPNVVSNFHNELAYNGTTQSCIGLYSDGVGGVFVNNGTTVILNSNGGSSGTQTGTVTVDATNISISWVKASSPSGTYLMLWKAV